MEVIASRKEQDTAILSLISLDSDVSDLGLRFSALVDAIFISDFRVSYIYFVILFTFW